MEKDEIVWNLIYKSVFFQKYVGIEERNWRADIIKLNPEVLELIDEKKAVEPTLKGVEL